MRIAHISDIHVARSLTFGDWNPKRLLGSINHRLFRSRLYTGEVAQQALAKALADKPGLVVLTGDMTQHGLDAEFAGVRELLAPVTGAGIPVIAVPGNHDIYGRDVSPALAGLLRDLAGGLVSGSTAGGVIRCGSADESANSGAGGGAVEILPLFQCIPTPLFCSYGRQDVFELERAGEFWQAPPQGVTRIVIGHYPVIDPHGGKLLRYRGLRGADLLMDFCAAHSVSAYFCGHDHKRFTAPMPGGCVQYAAPALSSVRTAARGRDLVRIYECGGGVSVREE